MKFILITSATLHLRFNVTESVYFSAMADILLIKWELIVKWRTADDFRCIIIIKKVKSRFWQVIAKSFILAYISKSIKSHKTCFLIRVDIVLHKLLRRDALWQPYKNLLIYSLLPQNPLRKVAIIIIMSTRKHSNLFIGPLCIRNVLKSLERLR